jgi:hypothetical protein
MAFAEDYIEVAARIAEWHDRFSEGRIVPEVIEWTDSRVMVKASVYRGMDPSEPPAGVGHSYLAIPGGTPFTRGAELENAETSAAGRALVMAGIPSKSVASADEVRGKNVGETTDGRAGLPAESSSSPPTAVAQGAQDAPSPMLSEAGGDSGNPGEGPEMLPASDDPRLTPAEVEALAKAFGGKVAARKIAQDRYGERVRSLADLTRSQALELVAERVG